MGFYIGSVCFHTRGDVCVLAALSEGNSVKRSQRLSYSRLETHQATCGLFETIACRAAPFPCVVALVKLGFTLRKMRIFLA